MFRVSSLLVLAALGGCSIFNTKADKGSAPSKENSGNAQGGQGGQGNNTEGNTSQGAVTYPEGSGESTLYVVNATSSYDVCWIYADTCDGLESGELLGDWYLPPNYYLQVDGLPDDCYDLWAFDCDDTAVWAYEANISGEFTWILTESGGWDSGYDSGYYYDTW